MRYHNPLLALAALAAGFMVTPAQAQYYGYGSYNPETNPVHWSVFGGVSEPLGNTSNLVQTGWNLGFGVTFTQPNNPFSLRLDFDYAYMNSTQQLLTSSSQGTGLQVSGGWSEVWTGTINAEYRVPFAPGIFGYLIAGGGLYYNSLSLTEYGYGYVCNPWWNYCYLGTGNVVTVSNSSTKFGWNAGLGVGYHLQGGASLFVEARYTWVDTSAVKFEYIPLVFGVRF